MKFITCVLAAQLIGALFIGMVLESLMLQVSEEKAASLFITLSLRELEDIEI